MPPTICDGCGKPPRVNDNHNGNIIPLKSCSRCHQAWYHDAKCQRLDYSNHKIQCRQQNNSSRSSKHISKKKEEMKATLNNNDDDDTEQSESSSNLKKKTLSADKQQSRHFEVQRREGRGRCLIAKQKLTKGTILGVIEPWVPPVLLGQERHLRCAICFRQLNNSVVGINQQNYPYIIQCCSSCAQPSWLKNEEQVVSRVLLRHRSKSSRIRIFPTAILLYRLYMASLDVHQQLEDLQYPTTNNNNHQMIMSEEEQIHCKAITTVTEWMLQETETFKKEKDDTSFSFEKILPIWLAKIKTNAFSIANGETVAIGIGLYPAPAYYANHSCSPNVIQTFEYGAGKVPSLRLTTCCSAISIGDELCVSYIDVSLPRNLCQERLKETYFFQCQCKRCATTTDDDDIGIRNSNGHDDHETTTMTRQKLMKSIEERSSISDWKVVFEKCQQLFWNTSWYFQESGEQHLHSLLMDFSSPEEEAEEQRMKRCKTALLVGKMVLEGKKTKQQQQQDEDMTISLSLLLLQYKCGKLRLYTAESSSDIGQAMQELQFCLEQFRLYYPPNHELIQGLQRDMGL